MIRDTRTTIFADGTAESRLADILRVMDKETFPKRKSESLVGGPGRLQKLVDKQKVRLTIRDNGRFYYNASDILRHIKN